MLISQAITFATQHPQFIQFMRAHNINPDDTTKLTAVVVPGHAQDRFGLLDIFLDLRAPGPGLGEIVMQIKYDRQTGTYIFNGIK